MSKAQETIRAADVLINQLDQEHKRWKAQVRLREESLGGGLSVLLQCVPQPLPLKEAGFGQSPEYYLDENSHADNMVPHHGRCAGRIRPGDLFFRSAAFYSFS